jgi:23S rRNA (adenine-N6)-dimethyltransferase
MPRSSLGRHELGQNYLHDSRIAARIAGLVPHGRRVVDLGAGDGALTRALLEAGHHVTAVELDPRRLPALRAFKAADVVQGDLLRYRANGPHNVVSNVPFGITTPLLRNLLAGEGWGTAVLLVQWEVARKRAAVGGTTLLTAAWWPWYTFTLAGRVPATAFRPVPSVDGGLLVLSRRAEPLLDATQRAAYQQYVGDIFTGRGAGLGGILRRCLPAKTVTRWLREQRLPPETLPGRLDADDWVSLYRLVSRA